MAAPRPPAPRVEIAVSVRTVLGLVGLPGVVGAILAVPFAAIIKIVLREASAPRRERMEALRAPAAGG